MTRKRKKASAPSAGAEDNLCAALGQHVRDHLQPSSMRAQDKKSFEWTVLDLALYAYMHAVEAHSNGIPIERALREIDFYDATVFIATEYDRYGFVLESTLRRVSKNMAFWYSQWKLSAVIASFIELRLNETIKEIAVPGSGRPRRDPAGGATLLKRKNSSSTQRPPPPPALSATQRKRAAAGEPRHHIPDGRQGPQQQPLGRSTSHGDKTPAAPQRSQLETQRPPTVVGCRAVHTIHVGADAAGAPAPGAHPHKPPGGSVKTAARDTTACAAQAPPHPPPPPPPQPAAPPDVSTTPASSSPASVALPSTPVSTAHNTAVPDTDTASGCTIGTAACTSDTSGGTAATTTSTGGHTLLQPAARTTELPLPSAATSPAATWGAAASLGAAAGAGAQPDRGGEVSEPPFPQLQKEFTRWLASGPLDAKLRNHLRSKGNSKIRKYCSKEGLPWSLMDLAAYGVALQKLAPGAVMDFTAAARFLSRTHGWTTAGAAAAPDTPPRVPGPHPPPHADRVARVAVAMQEAATKYDMMNFISRQIRQKRSSVVRGLVGGAGAVEAAVTAADVSHCADLAAQRPLPQSLPPPVLHPHLQPSPPAQLQPSPGLQQAATGAAGEGSREGSKRAKARTQDKAAARKQRGAGGRKSSAMELRLRTHLNRYGTVQLRQQKVQGVSWTALDLVVLDRAIRLEQGGDQLHVAEAARRLAGSQLPPGQQVDPELLQKVSAAICKVYDRYRLEEFVAKEVGKTLKQREVRQAKQRLSV